MSRDGVYSVDFAAEAEQLRQSMQARPSPDVAKGVLMVLYGCDGDTAFAELRRVSEQQQVLLSDLAAALVYLVNTDSGSVDGIDEQDADNDPRAVTAALQEWGPALARVQAATGPNRLYPLPRSTHRLAEAAEYITDLLTPRALVSLGMILRPREQESA